MSWSADLNFLKSTFLKRLNHDYQMPNHFGLYLTETNILENIIL